MARTRSRKRRPAGAKRPAGANEAVSDAAFAERAQATSAPERAQARKEHRPPRAAKRVRTSPAAPSYGERPHAPWHPLPLSELLILVGAIGAGLGLLRSKHGLTGAGPLLLVGVVAVALGTIEVTLREHRSGHRSHTVLLAGLGVFVVDAVVVLVLTAFTSLPRLADVGLLALDVALFAVLFKVLRARFLDARHARVLGLDPPIPGSPRRR